MREHVSIPGHAPDLSHPSSVKRDFRGRLQQAISELEFIRQFQLIQFRLDQNLNFFPTAERQRQLLRIEPLCSYFAYIWALHWNITGLLCSYILFFLVFHSPSDTQCTFLPFLSIYRYITIKKKLLNIWSSKVIILYTPTWVWLWLNPNPLLGPNSLARSNVHQWLSCVCPRWPIPDAGAYPGAKKQISPYSRETSSSPNSPVGCSSCCTSAIAWGFR